MGPMSISRRKFAASTVALLGATLLTRVSRAEGGPKMSVIKSASCGCCGMWVEHMKTNGFDLTVENVEDLYERKDKLKIPAELQSCHTGIVDGYIVEGHVPAADVQRLLKERPKALGIAVPGMPTGAPGMEMGSKKDAFKVILFTADGKQSVWNEYKGN